MKATKEIAATESTRDYSTRENFLNGYMVGGHSLKWKGYEKKELLEKLLCKLYRRVPGSVS